MKLNQVIAIANGEKSRKQKVLSKVYQDLGKDQLFTGIVRTYSPKYEDGEVFPTEKKLVQITVEKAVDEAINVMQSMFNIVGTLDKGNQKAVADIIVDSETIAKDVPATHLIFLEKQLEDVQTFIAAFPTLDPADEWEYSSDAGYYKSEPSETVKTKKVPKNHVLAEATDKHPAQVEMFTEDVTIGFWSIIKLSGCIPAGKKEILLTKVRKVIKAVKIAREEANSIEVDEVNYGTKVLDYIFG
jgi:hypothetical protein